LKKLLFVLLPLVLLGLVLAGWIYQTGTTQDPLQASVVGVRPAPEGFQRADGTLELSFPEDFGPHPDYQTEWWYYTGNLADENGRHFGYQLTFFRRAMVPPSELTQRESVWASDQVYLAHFALSDVEGNQHSAFERFSRGTPELAGATAEPFKVWLEDWEVRQTGSNTYLLQASQDEVEITLNLEDLKGPVLHGEEGYSQKGPDSGNASYYFSQTRLDTEGVVRVGKNNYQVSGSSWMDHEFSTSALSEGQVGWDWFSIQLDDGSELMVFQIRREDGSIDPYSSGTLINADASLVHLTNKAFSINVKDTWRSPRSGADYPAKWLVSVPEYGISLEIAPHLADQELNVSFTYWEGAVSIKGQVQGKKVSGDGYIEMTGYAESMEGEF
jgi:predicted secreted hydrolase